MLPQKPFVDLNFSLKNGYKVYTSETSTAQNTHTHHHDSYEIYMLLNSRVDFFADGAMYPLNPKELIAVRGTSPHGRLTVHNGSAEYMVIMLDKDFFVQNGCTQYEEIFYPHARGDRKISAATCENSGLYDVYTRLKKYTNNFTDTDNVITRTLLIEFLHILNTNTHFSKIYTLHPQVEKILTYIDENASKKLSLDEIAQYAYLSKYHMSRLFKKYVGCTINQYITTKRIERTIALTQEKKNITEACIEAGFSDYSAFYKAFVKLHGVPPKTMIKSK